MSTIYYCTGCGNSGQAPCSCGNWEFTDKAGLDLLASVGRIEARSLPASTTPQREAAAYRLYGSTSRIYSEAEVRQILRGQGYKV